MKVPHASDTHSGLVVVVVVVHPFDSALFVGCTISAYACLRMFEYCYPEATDPVWERVTESVACCPEATDPGWERVTKSVACHPEATDSGWERVTKSVACHPEATDPGWERVSRSVG